MVLNLTILATVAGALMALANYPQAIKILKRKSSKDVSLLTFSIILLGTIIWFVYGISIGNLPVIVSYGIGLTGSSFVIVVYFIYRGR
jgi:MtN3 and saliva related transmembrane protein